MCFRFLFFNDCPENVASYAIAGLCCNLIKRLLKQNNDMDIAVPVTRGFHIAVIMVSILKYFDVY